MILSLILSHLDYSLLINLVISLRFFLGGTMIDIMEVPLPLDSINFLINLLILNCSTDRWFCSSDSILLDNIYIFYNSIHNLYHLMFIKRSIQSISKRINTISPCLSIRSVPKLVNIVNRTFSDDSHDDFKPKVK